jgi:hypothetical protein
VVGVRDVHRGGLDRRVVVEQAAAHHVPLPIPRLVGIGVGVDRDRAAAALDPALERDPL